MGSETAEGGVKLPSPLGLVIAWSPTRKGFRLTWGQVSAFRGVGSHRQLAACGPCCSLCHLLNHRSSKSQVVRTQVSALRAVLVLSCCCNKIPEPVIQENRNVLLMVLGMGAPQLGLW
jgi:hypothetical protein